MPAFPRIDPNSQSQKLAPRQGAILAPNERFPKDFWLTPRTVLTRVTPVSKLNHFCVRHGAHASRPRAPSHLTLAAAVITAASYSRRAQVSS